MPFTAAGGGRIIVEREKITYESAPVAAPPRPAVAPRVPSAPRKSNVGPVAFVLAILLCLAGGLGLMAYMVVSVAEWLMPAKLASYQVPPGAPRLEQLPLVRIGTQRLGVEPPPGGFVAWDPIGRLSWAQTIATAWSAEATLRRIDVTGLMSSGAIDLDADRVAEVVYRYWPSAKPAEYGVEQERRAVVNGRQFAIHVRQSQLWIEVAELTRDPKMPLQPRPALDSLPLREIFARLSTRPDLPEAARYTGSLDYRAGDGWTWQLTDGAGTPLRMRASDGSLLLPAKAPATTAKGPVAAAKRPR